MRKSGLGNKAISMPKVWTYRKHRFVAPFLAEEQKKPFLRWDGEEGQSSGWDGQ
jgi:hypothetical protein